MSSKEYLLKALDASWVYEDAKLMQLIADAIDRSEELERSGDAQPTETFGKKNDTA